MLSAVKGIYENGKIVLTEEPPVKTKANVIITFLPFDEPKEPGRKQKITLGLLEGRIKLPDNFNEPLADLNEYM